MSPLLSLTTVTGTPAGYRHGSRGCWSSTDKWSTGHLCCKLRHSIHNPLSATMMLSIGTTQTNMLHPIPYS